jgi:hypothetical protein
LILNLAPQVMHLDIPKQDSWRGPKEAIRAGECRGGRQSGRHADDRQDGRGAR